MLSEASKIRKQEFESLSGYLLEAEFGSIKVYSHRWGHMVLTLETEDRFDDVLFQVDTDVEEIEKWLEAKRPRKWKKTQWVQHVEGSLIEYFGDGCDLDNEDEIYLEDYAKSMEAMPRPTAKLGGAWRLIGRKPSPTSKHLIDTVVSRGEKK